MRKRFPDDKAGQDCPGILILHSQGMFEWMRMPWIDLVAAGRMDSPGNPAPHSSSPATVELMASLVYQ